MTCKFSRGVEKFSGRVEHFLRGRVRYFQEGLKFFHN